ncbi:MAG: hydroxyisourate hydrolase [Proteobacteria bacterium]|nr:hydroxyisourate hydrolase [Pseudomonadota bacterium]
MAGRLTTHVLDTARGLPAAGVTIELYRLHGDGGEERRERLARTVTNADGRTDRPLLQGVDLRAARYELVFLIGDYFRRTTTDLAEPLFLDRVPLRFGVADPTEHVHVPLLASPWSYSTYRGS